MIDKLTKDQENKLIEFRKEWLSIGLSTHRVDKKTTNDALTLFYKETKNKTPYYWHVDSPIMANIVINILRANLGDNLWDNLKDNLGANLRANLRANLKDNLGANLRANLWDNLKDNLGANLRANLWANLKDNLGANLRANLWANLRDNLGDNLLDNLRDNLSGYIDTYFLGSIDSFWIAFYLFPHQVIKPIHSHKQMILLNGLADLAKSCFWWYPYKNICFISDRPIHINRDENGALHSENGPAVEFIDGWKTYVWHGTNVPEKWILDKNSITPEIITSHSNIEQRRAASEIIGWHNVLDLLSANLIDDNDNPQIGSLYEVNLPDVGTEKFIKFKCATGRTFSQPVPFDVQTAQEAQNWIWQKTNYQPILRT